MGKDQSFSSPPAPDYAGAVSSYVRRVGSGPASRREPDGCIRSTTRRRLGRSDGRKTGTETVPAEGNSAIDVPTYSQTVSTTPEGQDLDDRQLGLVEGAFSNLGQGSLDQTTASLSQRRRLHACSSWRTRPDADQTSSRLDPQWNQASTLAGNEADQPGPRGLVARLTTTPCGCSIRGKNDAYTQARIAAAEHHARRSSSLSTALRRCSRSTELNAIRSGAQPQMPTFQPTQTLDGRRGRTCLGRLRHRGQWDQGLYNQQVASSNAANSSQMGLLERRRLRQRCSSPMKALAFSRWKDSMARLHLLKDELDVS